MFLLKYGPMGVQISKCHPFYSYVSFSPKIFLMLLNYDSSHKSDLYEFESSNLVFFFKRLKSNIVANGK